MNCLEDLAIYIPEQNNGSASSGLLTPPTDSSTSNQSEPDPPTHHSLLPLDRVGGDTEPIGPRRRTRRGSTPRTPQQQARSVARRNARERKRVKLVNLGFATLREHIPPHLGAEAATPAKNRAVQGGGNKKLSKVDTLRCAIEYIKQLREAVGYEDSGAASIMDSGGLSPLDTSPSPSYCDTPSPVKMLMTDSRSPPMFNDDENDDFFNIVDWTSL